MKYWRVITFQAIKTKNLRGDHVFFRVNTSDKVLWLSTSVVKEIDIYLYILTLNIWNGFVSVAPVPYHP